MPISNANPQLASELEEESCEERAEGRNGRFGGVSRAQTAVTKARTHVTNQEPTKERQTQEVEEARIVEVIS